MSMKRSNRLHVAHGSMSHLHDVVFSIFVDFDCRQSSLEVPSTSTVGCGTVAHPPNACMDDSRNVHGVVMDGDAVTSLQRFAEFKSCYFLFRLRVSNA